MGDLEVRKPEVWNVNNAKSKGAEQRWTVEFKAVEMDEWEEGSFKKLQHGRCHTRAGICRGLPRPQGTQCEYPTNMHRDKLKCGEGRNRKAVGKRVTCGVFSHL